ncbi:hypothetical protein D6779_02050 [Candidatus Parcubacteria bacterium]|nr:MAG: hypothetical protein D6779_02050 [Candidatus Parcubacteria bacterium]
MIDNVIHNLSRNKGYPKMIKSFLNTLFSLPSNQKKLIGKVLTTIGTIQFLIAMALATYWEIEMRWHKSATFFGWPWWTVFLMVTISASILFIFWFIGYFLISSIK